MRYLIRAMAMATDIVLLAGAVWLALHPTLDNMMVLFVGLVLWQHNGGLMAWRPSVIRQFMANAKKLGL